MKRSFFALAPLFACLLSTAARAQSQTQTNSRPDDPPRYEAGLHFSALTLTPSDAYRTEIGFGGRITFNLDPHVALEAETTFFPNRGFSGETRATGRAFDGLFGVKAGRRWSRFGVFGKARPGFVSFGEGKSVSDLSGGFLTFRPERATHFATDVGGVLEFYVSRRLATRFDVGDTIIRYGPQTLCCTATPSGIFTTPEATRHNLQVTAGIGFRF